MTRTMAAAPNKQTHLTNAVALLKKKFPLEVAEPKSVLEELVYGILREGTNQEAADAAYATLREAFFDWNEIRVSSPGEVAEFLADLPNPGVRAQRVVGILQEWFELTYSFNMDDLAKKGLKEGARKLGRLHDVNDYSVAWVVQRGFGGHSLPLDGPSLRALHRLGIVEDPTDSLDAIAGTLEHYVPKAKGPLFTDLVSQLASEICLEKPLCPKCPLKAICPTAKTRVAPAAKTEDAKPRKSR